MNLFLEFAGAFLGSLIGIFIFYRINKRMPHIDDSVAQGNLSITSEEGAEVLMPNYAKEKFDRGEVKSIRDIL